MRRDQRRQEAAGEVHRTAEGYSRFLRRPQAVAELHHYSGSPRPGRLRELLGKMFAGREVFAELVYVLRVVLLEHASMYDLYV